jgi:hypothetical protein
MNHEEFRRYGKEMIDYIADYLVNIRLENQFFLLNFLFFLLKY